VSVDAATGDNPRLRWFDVPASRHPEPLNHG
jgi:hypothetical protein